MNVLRLKTAKVDLKCSLFFKYFGFILWLSKKDDIFFGGGYH